MILIQFSGPFFFQKSKKRKRKELSAYAKKEKNKMTQSQAENTTHTDTIMSDFPTLMIRKPPPSFPNLLTAIGISAR